MSDATPNKVDADFIRLDDWGFTSVDSSVEFYKKPKIPYTSRFNMGVWFQLEDESNIVDEMILEARVNRATK